MTRTPTKPSKRQRARPPWCPKKPKHLLRNNVLRCTATTEEREALGLDKAGHGTALRQLLGLGP